MEFSIQASGKVRADFGQVRAKFWQSLGKVWAKFGQSSGKVWAKFGQSLGKVWASSGKARAKFGQVSLDGSLLAPVCFWLPLVAPATIDLVGDNREFEVRGIFWHLIPIISG